MTVSVSIGAVTILSKYAFGAYISPAIFTRFPGNSGFGIVDYDCGVKFGKLSEFHRLDIKNTKIRSQLLELGYSGVFGIAGYKYRVRFTFIVLNSYLE